MTEIPTPSSNEKYESFKNELVEVEKRIENLSTYEHAGNSYYLIQDSIKTVLELLEEHNKGKKKTIDASDMRLKEILDEVKGFLIDFYKKRKEDFVPGTLSESFLTKNIVQVLDPFIKYGFLTTEEIEPWLEDSEVLQSLAYFLSNMRYLRLRYWLPSVEELANHNREEYLWLSSMSNQ
ncbi:hypothetical protein BY996DRAFT_8072603, partial [Phakopsora pachyrhizi]